MTRIPNRRAIIHRQALVDELEEQSRVPAPSQRARANTLQIFKAALYRGVAEIRRRFEKERITGAEVVHANVFLVDQLVRTIYDFACTHVYPSPNASVQNQIAISATGGYGRGELFPFSDIDLMFLLPTTTPPHALEIIEYVLYILWDSGLKVGHATRTVDDCVRLAKNDLTIRTSFIETRSLWGSQELYETFDRRFRAEVVAGTARQFVVAKLAERDARHERMGDSRYVLEPNIKEGKGGLRDLQTLFWIAKYIYQVKDIGDLVERHVFTESDARRFRASQNFLWNVRCHLHYVAGRPEERLTFNYQQTVGERLGYIDRANARGVEHFMKHYFHVTKIVGELTRVLCAVLEEEQRKPRLRPRFPSLARGLFRRAPAGFKLDGDRLTIDSADSFKEDPVRLLRLFHEAQRLALDTHPHALRSVQQNLKMINGNLRADPEANRIFMEMLTDEHDPETALKRLNDAGVIGRFVPDFGRVVALMQYDMYHTYTVDEHTIRAVGILSRIERGMLSEQHPTASEVIGEIRSRRALYLAVFLHDIAKGRNSDHSVTGGEIALSLGPRLGLDEWETETVSWLVRHHLLMSRTAFKRDIDDPKTVSDFTTLVQSPERLRLLLVLTNADIAAVGPNIWNGWKEGLLRELFYQALEDMELTGNQPARRRSVRVESAKGRLREILVDWDKGQLETYIARGYSDFWLGFTTDQHVRYFALMRGAEERNLPVCVEALQEPQGDVTELTIYAPDHPGLFAQITGAIALSSASIVDAKIITLANSMALDVFHIQDLNGHAVDSPERIKRMTERIEKAMVGHLDLKKELAVHGSRTVLNRTRVFRVPPRVIFDNKASVSHTVIEVNGADRPGFLYHVTSTLTSLGLQIVSAHISTYGERVVDVFYVKDVFGLKVEQPAKLERIERQLLKAMEAPEERTPLPVKAAE